MVASGCLDAVITIQVLMEVTTLAGCGLQGSVDGEAKAATFRRPCAVAINHAGDVFIGDANSVRKLSNGVVTTLAGGTTLGFKDGVGQNAKFNFIKDLAITTDGSIIVADWGNHRIRKITPEGAVSTIAGSGMAGFANG